MVRLFAKYRTTIICQIAVKIAKIGVFFPNTKETLKNAKGF